MLKEMLKNQDHRLAVAPMIDWEDRSIKSDIYGAVCAKIAHENPPSLPFSLVRCGGRLAA
jgi:hypothetical protein